MNIKIKKFQFQFLILLVTCGISSGCLWTQTAAGKGGQIGTDGRSGFRKATRRCTDR